MWISRELIQLLVGYSAFVRHLTKHGSTAGQYNVQVKCARAHTTLHLFWPRDQIEASGYHNAPTALLPGKNLCTYLKRKMGGPQRRSGCSGDERNVTSAGFRTPDRPAHRLLTIVTALCRLNNIGYSQTSRKSMIRLGGKKYTTWPLNVLYKCEGKTFRGGGIATADIIVLTSTVRPECLSLLEFLHTSPATRRICLQSS
jgi:hypothetical protein